MEKFLFLIREDLKLREQTADRLNEGIRDMTAWIESLSESGNHLQSDALISKARHVGKDYVLSDGPFIEAKEAVSGFLLILAENLEQAASIAQTCPLVIQNIVSIEVRPIMKE